MMKTFLIAIATRHIKSVHEMIMRIAPSTKIIGHHNTFIIRSDHLTSFTLEAMDGVSHVYEGHELDFLRRLHSDLNDAKKYHHNDSYLHNMIRKQIEEIHTICVLESISTENLFSDEQEYSNV